MSHNKRSPGVAGRGFDKGVLYNNKYRFGTNSFLSSTQAFRLVFRQYDPEAAAALAVFAAIWKADPTIASVIADIAAIERKAVERARLSYVRLESPERIELGGAS